jgi:hypothetical protein
MVIGWCMGVTLMKFISVKDDKTRGQDLLAEVRKAPKQARGRRNAAPCFKRSFRLPPRLRSGFFMSSSATLVQADGGDGHRRLLLILVRRHPRTRKPGYRLQVALAAKNKQFNPLWLLAE